MVVARCAALMVLLIGCVVDGVPDPQPDGGGAPDGATLPVVSDGGPVETVDAGAPGPVGRVGDLAVTATTETTLTLRFTEVDDGTGQPASYEVRYSVAPLAWGSAAPVTGGTCASPLAGVGIGQVRSCTVLGLSPSTAYEFQLVAFRGTLGVDTLFGALSNQTSGTTRALAGGDGEPLYVSGSDVSAFFDDFQVYASSTELTTWQSHYPDRWFYENGGPSMLLGDESGARFARAAYTPSQRFSLIGAAHSVGNTFGGGEEMVVTWDFRVMSGYEWAPNSDGGGNKIFLFFDDRLDFIIGSEPLYVGGSMRTWYSGWNARHFTCNTRGNNWQQNLNYAVNPDVINDGVWRRVTWAIRFANPVTAGNGRLRMWIGGTQVMEYDGANSARPEYGYVTLPLPSGTNVFHFPANRNTAPSSGTHTLDYDNVRIFKKN